MLRSARLSQVVAERPTVTRIISPDMGNVCLLRLPHVKARTGLSRSEIYRRVQSGAFPQPVSLGTRASAWVASEVDEYLASLIAARDAKAAA